MQHPSHCAGASAGFTLIEIMVVVVIVGLLATIVATNVFPARDSAELKKAASDVRSIADTIGTYMVVNGARVTPTLDELRNRDKKGRRWLDGATQDPWSHEYLIRDRNEQGVVVVSCGPDGIEGTEDDITSEAPDAAKK
jgi:general secretion pathway protein G